MREIHSNGEDYIFFNVHSGAVCAGRPCVVHNRQVHRMSRWPLWWSNKTLTFYRACGHGLYHPDPDQFHYWVDRGTLAAKLEHHCDGCCGWHDYDSPDDLTEIRVDNPRGIEATGGLEPADG